MDKKRAKEIAASPVMANVTYDGIPIYIESVNESSGTANIHPLKEPNNREEVELNKLMEE